MTAVEDLATVGQCLADKARELARDETLPDSTRSELLSLCARWQRAVNEPDAPVEGDDVPLRRRLGRAAVTPRQLALLEFFHAFRRRHGYSPTMQEIADGMGVSKVTVFEKVRQLQFKGVLCQRRAYKARSLMWNESRRRAVQVA